MVRFFRSAWLRVWLCWAVIRGRQVSLYANILQGRPTAYRVLSSGLEGGDSSLFVDCVSEVEEMRNGFVQGGNSLCVGCVASGSKGYGFNMTGNTFKNNPSDGYLIG